MITNDKIRAFLGAMTEHHRYRSWEHHRYRSWEHCYGYFHRATGHAAAAHRRRPPSRRASAGLLSGKLWHVPGTELSSSV
jgi:hypothetical protein